MTKPETVGTSRIIVHNGVPYIESRYRAIDDDMFGPVPEGKILVVRLPLQSIDPDDELPTSELIDDDGTLESFCPECAAAGHTLDELPFSPSHHEPWSETGRNERCPCGSGKKYKRCCLN